MKVLDVMLLTVLLASLTSVAASAQCTDAFQFINYPCTDGESCNKNILVAIPTDRTPGYLYSCSSDECCGELFTTCSWWQPSIPCDFDDELKNPAFRQELGQMALTSEILVRNCEGKYVPLPNLAAQVAPPSPLLHRARRSAPFIDDRLWR